MIIGINGRIGSGKDTVASIIEYLTTDKKDVSYTGSYNSYIMDLGMGASISSQWQIKRFADKLKEVASLLTGIPKEKFEDQEFKKTMLPDIWDRYTVYHLPDDGAQGDERQVVRHFGTEWEAENYVIEREKEDEEYNKTHYGYINSWLHVDKSGLSVRQLLQELGTDAMRDVIHPNVWVNALFADYKPDFKTRPGYLNPFPDIDFPNWIISDMRFPNEFDAVKERGGITVRVIRPNNPYPASNHASETSLDNYKDFDVEIINNGSLEELKDKVEKLIISKIN